MTFAQKFQTLRKQAGLSQEQLAERLSVSRQAISRWENGEVLPDAPNLVSISKLFGVSIDYLLHDDFDSEADLPAVQDVEARMQLRHKLDMLRVITIGVVALGFLWEIAAWMMFQSDWMMLAAITVQIIAAIVFKALLVRLPVDEEYRRRTKRRMLRNIVLLTLYFPLTMVMEALWAIYPRPRFAGVEELSALVLYLAVVLIVLRLTRENKD